MGNRGSVTIFSCLIIIAMVLLGITSVKVVGHNLAQGKGAVAVKSAMSSVNAGYNSYIFENYHILLFDKNCNGQGEAYLEEQLVRDIEYNLGQDFSVEELAISDYELVLEDGLQAFKDQMEEYVGYALLEYGADSILESTGGQDGTVADVIYEDMDAASSAGLLEGEEGSYNESDTEESDDVAIPWLEEEDPREYTENLSGDGILMLVMPEDMEISSRLVDTSSVPSAKASIGSWLNYEVDNDFDDIDILKEDIDVFDSWKNSLLEGGSAVAYGAKVFNCATEELQEDTVFALELEYIICGKNSDRENLKGVVNRLIGVRLPVNYAYLVTDIKKMAEVKQISVPIAFATFTPEPVVRYLIAGCWAYVESIFDVKYLLEGKRMEFFKSSNNWITDINDLEKSVSPDDQENEKGLSYKDYLIILMAMNIENNCYRMLDVIELNTKQYYEYFDMDNAVVGFSVDASISYDGRDFYYRESIGY